MAKQLAQGFDWNSTATDQLATLASVNGAFVKAMAKASQDYVEGFGKLTQEFSDFLNVRLQHDVDLGETMSKCSDWNEVAEAQQEWARQAGEEYLAEAQKLADLSVKLAANGAGLLAEPMTAGKATASKIKT